MFLVLVLDHNNLCSGQTNQHLKIMVLVLIEQLYLCATTEYGTSILQARQRWTNRSVRASHGNLVGP